MNDKAKNTLRLSIDDILSNSNIPDEITIPNDDQGTLPVKQKKKPNYAVIKDLAHRKAKRTLDGLFKFYLSEEIISQEEYISARSTLSESELSKMIFLMETSELMIITLMEQIDDGDMQPRMFEVLATLQKSLLDVVKAQTMYMVAAEETAKKLAREIDIFKPDKSASLDKGKSNGSPTGSISTRGQKDLMRAIAEANSKKKEDETDIAKSEEVKPRMDNRVKPVMPSELEEPKEELDNFDPGFDNEKEEDGFETSFDDDDDDDDL